MRGNERQVDVPAFADGLAVVQGLQHCELAGPLLDDACDSVQHLRALAPGHRSPGPLIGSPGGADGRRDVGGPSLSDLGQHLLGCGVHGLEPRAVLRWHELTIDEEVIRRGDPCHGT